MPPLNRRRAYVRVEQGRGVQRGGGLRTSIVKDDIYLVVKREGAEAEQAIFRLDNNLDVVGHIVRHQRGDADAKVHIKAVLQLASGLGRHLSACPDHQAPASSRRRVVRTSNFFS